MPKGRNRRRRNLSMKYPCNYSAGAAADSHRLIPCLLEPSGLAFPLPISPCPMNWTPLITAPGVYMIVAGELPRRPEESPQ
jgi:hypothetical protein